MLEFYSGDWMLVVKNIRFVRVIPPVVAIPFLTF